jgi:hypothetical protein
MGGNLGLENGLAIGLEDGLKDETGDRHLGRNKRTLLESINRFKRN